MPHTDVVVTWEEEHLTPQDHVSQESSIPSAAAPKETSLKS